MPVIALSATYVRKKIAATTELGTAENIFYI